MALATERRKYPVYSRSSWPARSVTGGGALVGSGTFGVLAVYSDLGNNLRAAGKALPRSRNKCPQIFRRCATPCTRPPADAFQHHRWRSTHGSALHGISILLDTEIAGQERPASQVTA